MSGNGQRHHPCQKLSYVAKGCSEFIKSRSLNAGKVSKISDVDSKVFGSGPSLVVKAQQWL